MKFTDYILIDAINPELKATDRDGVIREMVQSLVDAGGIEKENYESIVKALIMREELGSTGYRGVAFPETKHRNINRIVGAVSVSTEGIDFDALDEEKVQLFFLTISPPDCPGDHLRVMEHITRRLGRYDTLRESLKQAKTREEILALLEEVDNRRR